MGFSNERMRTGQLVNWFLLDGLELTPAGNPITRAQELPFGVDHLIGFNELLTCKHPEHAGVHFFLDDYQFERFWRMPERYLSALSQFPMVLGPTFSLYLDFPEPMQRWNHYRNQFLAAFLQSRGICCIQAPGWAGPDSYGWCFDGLSKGGAVAISSLGTGVHNANKDAFRQGFAAMLDICKPDEILFYGKVPPDTAALLRERGIQWQAFPHRMAERLRGATFSDSDSEEAEPCPKAEQAMAGPKE